MYKIIFLGILAWYVDGRALVEILRKEISVEGSTH